MVTVRLFAAFREAAGKKEVNISAKNIEELIRLLIARYKKLAPLLIKNTDPLELEDIIVLVNGRSIWYLEGVETKLKEEDVVSIFPLIGGG
ncbi:MAG TPA: MoaD family protein [Methanomicrobia archaeon]|nr:MoaD family protein [Methanomicrobia archaeon]